MTRSTERQLLTDMFLEAYLFRKVAEARSARNQVLIDIDGDSDSSGESESDSESESEQHIPPLSTRIFHFLRDLHSTRYLNSRIQPIKKTSAQLTLLLTSHKAERPEIFRRYLRVTPETFDALVTALEPDPVFQGENQASVVTQLAVALYRFGHFGNGASVVEVAMWAGIGYGTVKLYTLRVIIAVCRDTFRKAAIRWPAPNSDAQKEAKEWVESVSCPGWKNGWAMVDGTLVPLFARPSFYGNNWYDRKSNYSLNVQVSCCFHSHSIYSSQDLLLLDCFNT